MSGNFSYSQGVNSLNIDLSHRYMLILIFSSPDDCPPELFCPAHPASVPTSRSTVKASTVSRVLFLFIRFSPLRIEFINCQPGRIPPGGLFISQEIPLEFTYEMKNDIHPK